MKTKGEGWKPSLDDHGVGYLAGVLLAAVDLAGVLRAGVLRAGVLLAGVLLAVAIANLATVLGMVNFTAAFFAPTYRAMLFGVAALAGAVLASAILGVTLRLRVAVFFPAVLFHLPNRLDLRLPIHQ